MTNLPEHGIIKLILIKDIYNKYYKYISINYIKENYPELYVVFNAVSTAHAKTEGDVSLDDVHAIVLASSPNMSDTQRGVYDALFNVIRANDASADTIVPLLKQAKQKALLAQLALASFEASTNGENVDKVTEAIRELQTDDVPEDVENHAVFVSDDLEVLKAQTVSQRGLRWRLSSLNQSLGSLRRGDFGFLFARPETGKTTFLCSEGGFMAEQLAPLGLDLLHCNNEEQGNKVMMRYYQSILGLRLEQLLTGVNKHRDAFREKIRGSIKLFDQAIITRRDIEDLCARTNPGLIIIDQIDKIQGFSSDREDLRLGAIYQWGREIAKTYAPVIGVCQADGTAEGVKWLTMAHVANAKTSKQAEADWILGIGRTDEDGMEQVRHFNISKNKLLGDDDSIPAMRHGRWDVLIQPEIGRYKDILE